MKLSQNPSFSKKTIISGLPFSNILLFVERSMKELNKSVYEEMASAAYHSIWLDGMAEYLVERFNKIEAIEAQIKKYISD